MQAIIELFCIITALCWATVCLAVHQKFGFHTEWGCNGDALILQNKHPNVEVASWIISISQSYSISGAWGIFRGVNYTDLRGNVGGAEESRCYNSDLQDIKSLRYLGPPDTTTHSISFYQDISMAGQEILVTGLEYANIPFEPKSIFISGNSGWTFFTGTDFDGTAICVTPREPITNGWYTALYTINSTLSNVGSVLKGCNSRVDQYFFP